MICHPNIKQKFFHKHISWILTSGPNSLMTLYAYDLILLMTLYAIFASELMCLFAYGEKIAFTLISLFAWPSFISTHKNLIRTYDEHWSGLHVRLWRSCPVIPSVSRRRFRQILFWMIFKKLACVMPKNSSIDDWISFPVIRNQVGSWRNFEKSWSYS